MVSPISNAKAKVAMPPPPLKPEDAFKKIDSTNKGFITESELASAIVQFSPEGISLSPKGRPQGGATGGRPSGPPPGPPPGIKESASSGTNTNYDAADTNKDGAVSALERLAYASKSQLANTSDVSTATQKQ
ncbi:MAG: hypothetical protein RLZZ573_1555 [Pseudomonadota bacterium]|jgi:hypothetical protein